MLNHLSLVCVAALVAVTCAAKVDYTNYKVFRFPVKNEADVAVLKQIQEQGVDFWTDLGRIGDTVDVMLAPEQVSTLNLLKNYGIFGQEIISDVQSLINSERVSDGKAKRLSWTQYYTLPEIQDWLLAEAAARPDIASVESVGQSYEGRELYVLKLSKNNAGTNPIVFIDANIHSREWITSAVATYVINELLNGNNTELNDFLDVFDIHILPVLNPDGFTFSHTTNRLWRKTRSEVDGNTCRGADPNRNWDFHWLEGGSSTNPCSDTFAGAQAFSEPETLALSRYLTSLGSRLQFYLSIHSYGHYILIPYGHTPERIPEYDEYFRIGSAAADAIAVKYGTRFTPGNVVDLLYVASAESFDWVKGVLNPYLSMGIELRDQGQYGFLLPANQIIPSGEEFVDGLIAFMTELQAALKL